MYHETVVQVPPVAELADEFNRLQLRNTELQEQVRAADQRIVQLVEQVNDENACRREAEQELVNFKRRVTERMHREADRRQWCSEYDDIMEEMGLERRSRDWEVEFVVSGRFTRVLRARNEETARRLALEEVRITTDRNYDIGDEYVYIDDLNIESVVEAE